MVMAAVLLTAALVPRAKPPDVFIGIASMSLAPGIREAEALLVYQPGALAVPIGRAWLRPYVSIREASVTGRSASVGVQFVYVRPRR